MNDVPQARFIEPDIPDDPQILVFLDQLERLLSEYDGLDPDGPYARGLVNEMRLIVHELDFLGHKWRT
jgi:hypothetical protein